MFVMRKINRAIITWNVHDLIAPFGGTKALAKQLVHVRHMSAGKVESRLKTAENIGLAKQGGDGKRLRYILDATNPTFLKRIQAINIGMTDKQICAYKFLITLKVPPQQAQKLCQTQMASRELFLTRAKEIAKFELSSEKYGMSKIPVTLIKHFIHLPPSKIKRFLEKSPIMRKLQNEHSAKVLDAIFPLWSRIGQLKKIAPITVLAKVEYLINNGILLHGRYIRQYSLEQLPKVKNTLQKMTEGEKLTMLQRLEQARKNPSSQKN